MTNRPTAEQREAALRAEVERLTEEVDYLTDQNAKLTAARDAVLRQHGNDLTRFLADKTQHSKKDNQ